MNVRSGMSLSTLPRQMLRPARGAMPLKFLTPALRDGVALRPELQALLAEVRARTLTLVISPAGYGKTTLLSHWARDLNRTGARVCWMTLDTTDQDPGIFLANLIRMMQYTFPEVGSDALRVLASAANPDRDWPLAASALCNDLQRYATAATFLFLDDLHLIADSAVIVRVLQYILRAIPPTLRIVSAARRLPAVAPFARLRAEGQLLEVQQRELHLTSDEARRILAAQDVELADDDLDVLLARTEGWALSIQLVALKLAELNDEQRHAFVRALGGGQEQLLGYLAAEVLGDLPHEVLEFLQLAALPSRFDAAVLAEVMNAEDVAYLLRRAQALGLPIIPLDDQGVAFRFHPLWREILQLRLQQESDLVRWRALHLRFGQVFEQRDDLEQALELYARADATEDLARALRDHAWPLLYTSAREGMRRWLARLPEDVLHHDPELLAMWGVSQIVSDPTQSASALERAAELHRQAANASRELRTYSDLAALYYMQSRPDDLISVCVRAAQSATRARDPWSRGSALVCAAVMLAAKGRLAASLRVTVHARAHPLSPIWYWLLAMVSSAGYVRLGRPSDAVRVIDEALKIEQIDHDDRLRQNLLFQRSLARYLQGYTSEALLGALEAHRYLGDYYRDATAGDSAAQLALMLSLQGRMEEAMTYVGQARSAFHYMGRLAPLTQLQVIELFGLLMQGQGVRAAAQVPNVWRRLEEASARSPDLRLHLLLAIVMGEGGEHRRALGLATAAAQRMQAEGYRLFLAEAHLYRSYLAGLCNEPVTRQQALQAGWDIIVAEQFDYIPFLPIAAVRDVAATALEQRLQPEVVARVLRRQLPDVAVELCQGLLNNASAPVREQAARILGDLGVSAAFPILRGLLKDRSNVVRQAADDALNRLVYRPPYRLRVRTLGSFSVSRGDQDVKERDWRSRKAVQLFQLLISEAGRALSRDQVLETLWPEMDADTALNNLRVTINRMGRALDPERPEGAPSAYIIQQGDTLSFNMESDFELDIIEFTGAVTQGRHAEQLGRTKEMLAAYQRAVSLYGGTYLPDTLYEDWTVVERERLAMLFNDTAIRLGTRLLSEGQPYDAIGLAWRVLENDRTYEEAYRLLMNAHMLLGERNTALRLYERCVSVLKDDLGVEPTSETAAIHRQLKEIR